MAFLYSQYYSSSSNFSLHIASLQFCGPSYLYHYLCPPRCLFHQLLLSSRTLIPSQFMTALQSLISHSKPACEGCSWSAFPKCPLHPKISPGHCFSQILVFSVSPSYPLCSSRLESSKVIATFPEDSTKKVSLSPSFLGQNSPFYLLVKREKSVLDKLLASTARC